MSRRKIGWLIDMGTGAVVIGLLAWSRGCSTALPEDSQWVQQTAKFERKIEVDGLDLRVIEAGPGDAAPVLLIHGWTDSTFTWREVIPRLKDRYRLVALDLPGSGYSDKPDPAWGYRKLAAACVAVLDRLQIDRAFVVGNSMGGATAIRLAADFPGRVLGLVPLDAGTPRDEDDAFRLVGLLEVPVIGEIGMWVMGPMMYRAILSGATAEGREISDDEIEEMYRIFNTAGGRRAALDQMREIKENPVSWEAAESVQAPTLIIWGRQDQWTPLKYGKRLAQKITGARIEIIEDSGHLPQWEVPGQVAALLDAFFRKVLASIRQKKMTERPHVRTSIGPA